MRHLMTYLSTIVISLIGTPLLAHSTTSTNPVGLWQSIDDVRHEPRSIIKITEDKAGSLSGKIVRIFYRKGEKPNDICVMCTGKLHNQRILGMTILSHLHKAHRYWQGGSIVDPENGKTYRCRLSFVDNSPNNLKVRGYIGIPLLGRSQIWHRVKSIN